MATWSASAKIHVLLAIFASTSTSQDIPNFAVDHGPLMNVPLDELAEMMSTILSPHFRNVKTAVVQCPDLTTWGLAAPGIGGMNRLVEVGGDHHLLTEHANSLTIPIDAVSANVHFHGAYFLGGGIAPLSVAGSGELIVSDHSSQHGQLGTRRNRLSTVNEAGDVSLEKYTSSDLSYRTHLMASEGLQEQVVEVHASVRTSTSDECASITKCIQVGLSKLLAAHEEYTEPYQQIGLGGVIEAKNGLIQGHVMRDSATQPLTGDETAADYHRKFNASKDVILITTLLSADPMLHPRKPNGLDLERLEHTQLFSDSSGVGGQYHGDTNSSERIQYHGYFVPNEAIYTIDFEAPVKAAGHNWHVGEMANKPGADPEAEPGSTLAAARSELRRN